MIPGRELEESYSRAGGAGGQHVNKVSTKVTLRWNLRTSSALNERQRALLEERLGARLTGDGTLVLQVGESRSQLDNRKAVRERLAALLAGSLKVQKKRRPTRPSRGARERRLSAKKKRSELKSARGRWKGD